MRAIILSLLISVTCYADDVQKAKVAQESKRFTVRVLTSVGNVFTSDVYFGHGTGFITALSPTEGIVFTNAHVVDVDKRSAVKVEIEFFGEGDMVEKCPAEVIFESPIHDFAVLRFDPTKLKHLGSGLRAATLATPQEVPQLAQTGVSVMVAGNPLNSKDICTYGTLSGFHVLEWHGRYLQVDAAINPGNSGGPLIHIASGKVIGINSAKIVEADNMGFTLPIDVATRGYEMWKKDRSFANKKSLITVLGRYSMDWIHGLGLQEEVERENIEPNLLQRYEGFYVVEKAYPKSGLKQGDVILTANGVSIGDRGYRLREVVQEAGETIEVKVIRKGAITTVPAKVFTTHDAQEKGRTRFLTFSGFLFEELDIGDRFVRGDSKSAVLISEILPSSIAADRYSGLAGAAVVGVQVGTRRKKVRSLDDLLKAIERIPEQGPFAVTLILYVPIQADEILTDRVAHLPMLSPHPRDIVMAVHQLMSHETHDFDALRQSFDFSGFHNLESRGGLNALAAQVRSCAGNVANP